MAASRSAPPIPGAILLQKYLIPHHISMMAAAKRLGLSQQLVNQIVRGENPITARTALRLARLFKTKPELWLDLQRSYDLWYEAKVGKSALAKIKPL